MHLHQRATLLRSKRQTIICSTRLRSPLEIFHLPDPPFLCMETYGMVFLLSCFPRNFLRVQTYQELKSLRYHSNRGCPRNLDIHYHICTPRRQAETHTVCSMAHPYVQSSGGCKTSLRTLLILYINLFERQEK